MSFSKSVKNEIIKKNLHKKETLALLQGLFLSAGSLIISNKKLSFVVSNESEDVILCVKQKLLEIFENADIQIVNIVKSFKTKERFELAAYGDDNERILTKLGIIYQDAEGNQEISDVCDKGYLETKEKMLAFLILYFSTSLPSGIVPKTLFVMLI